MATEAEIAWAAGLFEGEGCFSVWTGAHGRSYVRAQLGMKDGDVVERFAALAGAGKVRKRRTAHERWSPIFEWSTADSEAVRSLIVLLLPWLGERRAAKAREALEVLSHVQTAAKNRTHCAKGHPYDDDNTRIEGDGTYRWRRCRSCKRDYDQARHARAEAVSA
ncbi:MAG: hypothetical protein NUW01_04970 [Gemmatimonadaceae bacterium]|nr:hypothetical protein [Gemmatimonadaceae bacterium]